MKNPILPRIAICSVFFVSGAVALVYEILWSRQFVTVFGNSAYSISIVLSAFMAGLGVGSLLFGRRADRTTDPLRLYAFLELGIAASALLIPVLLDFLRTITPGLFNILPGDLTSVSLIRLVFSFVILFIPCCLIGGTLPVLARFCVEARGVVGQRIGILYGFNTLGGAFGCFAAGYFLIETLGLSVTSWIAVAGNITIAAAALLIRRVRPASKGVSREPDHGATASTETGAASGSAAGRRLLLFTAFLSGFTTLGCEVLWARFLAFICHSNPYTFTAILGLFLVGLALGSLIYRTFLARVNDRFFLLGVVQILIGMTVIAALVLGSRYIEASGPDAQGRILGKGDHRYTWPLLVALIFVFVPTLVMGIVFPLVCAAFTRSLAAVGRSVGLVYGLNTVGCIAGSLAPVFLLIPLIGIQFSLVAYTLLSVAVGAVLICYGASLRGGRLVARRVLGAAAIAITALVCLAAPGDLTRTVFLQGVIWVGPEPEIIYYDEGRTGTSMVVRDRIDGKEALYINSVLEVPTTHVSLGIFRLMGHLGPLLHPDPREALVICFGGGVAGGTLNLHPDVKSLHIVDLESSVIKAAELLHRENNAIHLSDKLSIFIEDGRNYLLTCQKKYPVILCDSTHPKSADSWVLYTREFYETVDSRLADPGLFIQWLPYHGLSEEEYKIIVRTFQETFPNTSLWVLSAPNERGDWPAYTLMVAQKPGISIDLDVMARRLAVPKVRADLVPFAMETPEKILRHFVCAGESVRRWTDGLPVNTDDLPFTQYQTRYSDSPLCGLPLFVPILESPWPYISNRGDEEEAARLEERLLRCIQARRFYLTGRLKDARSLLPYDSKLNIFEQKIREGRRWRERINREFKQGKR